MITQKYILYEIFIQDDNGKRDTKDMALLYMLAQNGHHGSEYASHQMNSILPLLLLNKVFDFGEEANA